MSALPRWFNLITALAVVFGSAEALQFLTFLGPKTGTAIAGIAGLVNMFVRALPDADGDGTPDVFQPRNR